MPNKYITPFRVIISLNFHRIFVKFMYFQTISPFDKNKGYAYIGTFTPFTSIRHYVLNSIPWTNMCCNLCKFFFKFIWAPVQYVRCFLYYLVFQQRNSMSPNLVHLCLVLIIKSASSFIHNAYLRLLFTHLGLIFTPKSNIVPFSYIFKVFAQAIQVYFLEFIPILVMESF